VGGCAVDIDTEHDYEVAKECFEPWRAEQRERAARCQAQLASSAS
jgi:hypothetical protein